MQAIKLLYYVSSFVQPQTEKKLTLAVRETRIPRHNGIQLRAPRYNNAVMFGEFLEGFKEGLNWAHMMPRDANLSDSYTSNHCCLFQTGWYFVLQYETTNISHCLGLRT